MVAVAVVVGVHRIGRAEDLVVRRTDLAVDLEGRHIAPEVDLVARRTADDRTVLGLGAVVQEEERRIAVAEDMASL